MTMEAVEVVDGEIVSLTEQIHYKIALVEHSSAELSILVLEAHETPGEWKPTYGTWEKYVKAEFGWGREYGHRLVNQGKTVSVLAEKCGHVATLVEITEKQARDIKPVLNEVSATVEARVAELDDPEPAQVQDVVTKTVQEYREVWKQAKR